MILLQYHKATRTVGLGKPEKTRKTGGDAAVKFAHLAYHAVTNIDGICLGTVKFFIEKYRWTTM